MRLKKNQSFNTDQVGQENLPVDTGYRKVPLVKTCSLYKIQMVQMVFHCKEVVAVQDILVKPWKCHKTEHLLEVNFL